MRSPSPNPNHGFVVRLEGGGDDGIVVDASYNAAEWKSLDEALRAALNLFTREQKAEGGDDANLCGLGWARSNPF